jgi:hypothetical protein
VVYYKACLDRDDEEWLDWFFVYEAYNKIIEKVELLPAT